MSLSISGWLLYELGSKYWVDTSGTRTEVSGQSGGKAIADGENRLEAPAGESDSYVLRLRVAA